MIILVIIANDNGYNYEIVRLTNGNENAKVTKL